MKAIIVALFILSGFRTQGQKAYEVSNDPKNNQVTFKGPITFSDLNNEPSFTWLNKGRKSYKPDGEEIKVLKERFASRRYSMVVFMGTWCGDSHELIPELEVLLQRTNFPMDMYTMYGADRKKTTKGGEEKNYNITLVPTVILLEDGKELGRITEAVQNSLEADLVAILHK
jgi:thiol-disulfide isomerase/thioredoxin